MDIPPVNSTEDQAREARAPRGGLQLMALILVAFTGLAIYSNVQNARRGQIETVTITPAAPATPSPPPAAP